MAQALGQLTTEKQDNLSLTFKGRDFGYSEFVMCLSEWHPEAETAKDLEALLHVATNPEILPGLLPSQRCQIVQSLINVALEQGTPADEKNIRFLVCKAHQKETPPTTKEVSRRELLKLGRDLSIAATGLLLSNNVANLINQTGFSERPVADPTLTALASAGTYAAAMHLDSRHHHRAASDETFTDIVGLLEKNYYPIERMGQRSLVLFSSDPNDKTKIHTADFFYEAAKHPNSLPVQAMLLIILDAGLWTGVITEDEALKITANPKHLLSLTPKLAASAGITGNLNAISLLLNQYSSMRECCHGKLQPLAESQFDGILGTIAANMGNVKTMQAWRQQLRDTVPTYDDMPSDAGHTTSRHAENRINSFFRQFESMAEIAVNAKVRGR